MVLVIFCMKETAQFWRCFKLKCFGAVWNALWIMDLNFHCKCRELFYLSYIMSRTETVRALHMNIFTSAGLCHYGNACHVEVHSGKYAFRIYCNNVLGLCVGIYRKLQLNITDFSQDMKLCLHNCESQWYTRKNSIHFRLSAELSTQWLQNLIFAC